MATVDASGLVTAVAPGLAIITVTGSVNCARASVNMLVSPNTAGEAEVAWVSGETGPEGWSLAPLQPTASDILHFSGTTAKYGNECMAITATGTPSAVVNLAAHSIQLLFELAPVKRCSSVWDPVCGLGGRFGPLPEGDWVFSGHNGHDTLISFDIHFHVGPPAPANRVPANWISGEAPPPAWTAEMLPPGMPLNGIHLSWPMPLHPNACDGEAALGGAPFISIDETAHALALVFQSPPPQVCYDIYAPVCGLQADIIGLADGVWTFSAPMLAPPVQFAFTIGAPSGKTE